jgi:hypothetical protein
VICHCLDATGVLAVMVVVLILGGVGLLFLTSRR